LRTGPEATLTLARAYKQAKETRMPSIPLVAALLAAALGATPSTLSAPDTAAPRWVAETGG